MTRTWQNLLTNIGQAALHLLQFLALLALGAVWAFLFLLPWAVRVGLVMAWFLVLLWAMMVWPAHFAPLSSAHAWTVRLIPLAIATLPLAATAHQPRRIWGSLALTTGVVVVATWTIHRLWDQYAFYLVTALPILYLAMVVYLAVRFQHVRSNPHLPHPSKEA